MAWNKVERLVLNIKIYLQNGKIYKSTGGRDAEWVETTWAQLQKEYEKIKKAL
jgi:hypothetical protein